MEGDVGWDRCLSNLALFFFFFPLPFLFRKFFLLHVPPPPPHVIKASFHKYCTCNQMLNWGIGLACAALDTDGISKEVAAC